MMGTDMKESGKMTIGMVKVRKVIDLRWFIDSNIVQFFQIGTFFFNDGDRYEGEWKDDKMHGQGKKSYWFKMIYWF